MDCFSLVKRPFPVFFFYLQEMHLLLFPYLAAPKFLEKVVDFEVEKALNLALDLPLFLYLLLLVLVSPSQRVLTLIQ